MLALLLECIGAGVVGFVLMLVGLVLLLRYTKGSSCITKGYQAAADDRMVYVHSFPRESCRQVVNLSPYTVKLETWLRLHKIKYEFVGTYTTSKRKQMPYVVIGGEQIADSSNCIEELSRRFSVVDEMSARDAGLSRALTAMIELRLSWTYLYYRYVVEFNRFKRVHLLPRKYPILNNIVRRLLRLGVMFSCRGNGITRRPRPETYDIGRKDILALNDVLGDKKFLMGDNMNEVDCALFGQLVQIHYVRAMDYPQRAVLEQCPCLIDYIERIRAEQWPDWSNIVDDEEFVR